MWHSAAMHPMERLRYLARSHDGDRRSLVRETAESLALLDAEAGELLVACRAMLDRHLPCGPLWWLAARVLADIDGVASALGYADEIETDPTPTVLAQQLPAAATVVLVGWPDLGGEALLARGDLRVLVLDDERDGRRFVRRLQGDAGDAELVSVLHLAEAVGSCDLVLIEAMAAGDGSALCALGSTAAAAVAYCTEVPVWLTVGRGTFLPTPLWQALCAHLDRRGSHTGQGIEMVPLSLASTIVTADGSGRLQANCEPTPELQRLGLR